MGLVMRLVSILIALVVLVLLNPLSLHAQGSGSIEGLVTDAVSGEKLPGANVWLEGTGLGASANLEGKYVIAKVPVGKYTLNIRYIGYISKSVALEVKADEKIERNFALTAEALEGETVVVTAQARGQHEAINQQLSSNTIKNVVAAEKIHQLPDASAATALSRLPGVSLMNGDQVVIRGIQAKLNTVMINGIPIPSTGMTDRAANLGFISSNLLSGIEVIKALTPDMDANAIGGVVNLRLREAPSDFHGDLFLQGNYNTQDRTPNSYKVWGSASYRFFDDKFGVFLQGNADKSDIGQDRYNAAFQFNQKYRLADYGEALYTMQNFVFTDEWNVINNSGGSIIMDYQLPHGKIIMQNTFTSNLSSNTNFRYTLNFDQATTGYGIFRDKYGKELIINALQAEYNFGDVKAEFSLSHSYADKYTRNRYGDLGNPFGFNSITDVHPYGVLPDGRAKNYFNERDTFTPEDVMNLYLDPTDVNRAVVGGWIVARTEAFDQHLYNSTLDFTVPVTITEDVTAKFKVGGKFTRTVRNNDVNALFDGSTDPDYYNATRNFFPNHPGISQTNPVRFTDLWNQDYKRGQYFLESTYPFLYAYDRDLMDRYMETSISGWVKGPHYPYSTRDDFNGSEIFSAGYVMGSFDFGPRLSLIAGGRYEHYNMDYHGRFYYCTHAVYGYGVQFDTLNRVDRSDNDFFPNAQLRYKVTDWSDIRLAYTKGISRPDYNAIMPSVYIEPGGYAIAGNTKLKPAIATNYDANVSFYSNDIGLLTVGGFVKKINNVFFQSAIFYGNLKYYDVSFPDSTTWAALGIQPAGMPTVSSQINTFQNNPNPAWVRGFEVEWQSNFWYLPKPLNSLVLSANYTRAWSDMDYKQIRNIDSSWQDGRFTRHKYISRDTVRNARLLYQSNDVVNVALGVDYKGFSGRISFNMIGNIITSVGSRPEEDQYTGNIYRWDVTLQQELPIQGFKLIFDGVNIFHNPIKTYQKFRRVEGGPIYENLQSTAYSPRIFNLSLRYSL
jgi:TonB-dependent receptor